MKVLKMLVILVAFATGTMYKMHTHLYGSTVQSINNFGNVFNKEVEELSENLALPSIFQKEVIKKTSKEKIIRKSKSLTTEQIIESIDKRETCDISDLFIADGLDEYVLCYWAVKDN